MSKITLFIVFNVFAYVAYWLIDRLLTLLNLYSNPQLGQDISVMPTQGDMILIGFNVFVSSIIGYYLMRRMKTWLD